MKEIVTLKAKPIDKPFIRVAAYARVSMDTERLSHSLTAQVEYYNQFIASHDDWIMVGIFADLGISGTSADRPEFQKLLTLCDEGKVDLILCKSISRFARNTLDLLRIARNLKAKGIEIRFEKENLSTFSDDGELMLSLIASFAEEESLSISKNVRWGTVKRFEMGIPNGQFIIWGYRWINNKLEIYEDEAKWVRYAYDVYLKGGSCQDVANHLNALGIKTYKGLKFIDSQIRTWITNITYTGNLILQKEYVYDPLTHRSKKNRGELDQFFVENHHEPVISMDIFNRAQAEKERRRTLGVFANKAINTTVFTSKIKCGKCGKSYVRSAKRNKAKYSAYGSMIYSWVCSQTKEKGGLCSGHIYEEKIKEVTAKVLGISEFNEKVFIEKIDKIVVFAKEHKLVFYFYDGRIVEENYTVLSHTISWNDERRALWSKLKATPEGVSKKAADCVFSCMLRCEKCGKNFRRFTIKHVDGEKFKRWSCPTNSTCHNHSIKETTLIDKTKELLQVNELTDDLILSTFSYIGIDDDTINYHFLDGKIKKVKFEEIVIRRWSKETRARREANKYGK